MCTNEVTRTLQITLECNVVLRSDITQDVCKTTAVFSWADGFQYANAEREIFFLVKDDIKMVVVHFFVSILFVFRVFLAKTPRNRIGSWTRNPNPREMENPRNGMQLENRKPRETLNPREMGCNLKSENPAKSKSFCISLSTETKTCAFLWVDVIQGRKTDHHVSFVVHYS